MDPAPNPAPPRVEVIPSVPSSVPIVSTSSDNSGKIILVVSVLVLVGVAAFFIFKKDPAVAPVEK